MIRKRNQEWLGLMEEDEEEGDGWGNRHTFNFKNLPADVNKGLNVEGGDDSHGREQSEGVLAFPLPAVTTHLPCTLSGSLSSSSSSSCSTFSTYKSKSQVLGNKASTTAFASATSPDASFSSSDAFILPLSFDAIFAGNNSPFQTRWWSRMNSILIWCGMTRVYIVEVDELHLVVTTNFRNTFDGNSCGKRTSGRT